METIKTWKIFILTHSILFWHKPFFWYMPKFRPTPILWAHATHTKISTHATHAVFLTHAKILWTHATHAKVWPIPPTHPCTHAPTQPMSPRNPRNLADSLQSDPRKFSKQSESTQHSLVWHGKLWKVRFSRWSTDKFSGVICIKKTKEMISTLRLHIKLSFIVFLFQAGDHNDKHNQVLQVKPESHVKYFFTKEVMITSKN